MIVTGASEALLEYNALEYSIMVQEISHDDATGIYEDKEGLFLMSSSVNAAKSRVTEISDLSDNWDGYGAPPVPERVIKNCFKFIDALSTMRIPVDSDDIVPTPYGTVDIDLHTRRGLVSVEIGNSQIGYFTEFEVGGDFSSDGINTTFKEVPAELQDVLGM